MGGEGMPEISASKKKDFFFDFFTVGWCKRSMQTESNNVLSWFFLKWHVDSNAFFGSGWHA